jgi:succinate dehydrogenase/fumarate reductase flavoprotein subunit
MKSDLNLTFDVVVVGAGATGLAAAISSIERGASVVVIEANYDVGGHAIQSGGSIPIGGGTSIQKKYGVNDSADLVFSDLVSDHVVNYRFNDRRIVRTFAENCAQTFEWLIANGVIFLDREPEPQETNGRAAGTSAKRTVHVRSEQIVNSENPTGAVGAGLVRPLETSARKLGARFLLNYSMTEILRQDGYPWRVVGVVVQYTPRTLPDSGKSLSSYMQEGNLHIHEPQVVINANKAVVIATGGHSSNVNFRRIFDPRLGAEYQVVGEPYSFQDASGELAAMAIGASLWGGANQSLEFGSNIVKPSAIGCQYGYMTNTRFRKILDLLPNSPIFPLIRATGLPVSDYQDLILVNQAGLRFWDETKGNYPESASWESFISAALSINPASVGPDYSAGPIWAIFDSNAVLRENWNVKPPNVDPNGYFFSADTIKELAGRIFNQYQKNPIDPITLQQAVDQYNSFVDGGKDLDFNKPKPKWKIDTPPFYAAFATPLVHDTRAGLRIDGNCQVLDTHGGVISGLYCGGESAGGFSQHGLARCLVQGRIAGINAAASENVTDAISN